MIMIPGLSQYISGAQLISQIVPEIFVEGKRGTEVEVWGLCLQWSPGTWSEGQGDKVPLKLMTIY